MFIRNHVKVIALQRDIIDAQKETIQFQRELINKQKIIIDRYIDTLRSKGK